MSSSMYCPAVTRRTVSELEENRSIYAVNEKGIQWGYLKDVLGELGEGKAPTHLFFPMSDLEMTSEAKLLKKSRAGWLPRQLDSYVTNAQILDMLLRGHNRAEIGREFNISQERVDQRCARCLEILFHRALREEKIPVELAMALIILGNVRYSERIRKMLRAHFTREAHYEIGLVARARLRGRRKEKQ